jgi:hypothetical protein
MARSMPVDPTTLFYKVAIASPTLAIEFNNLQFSRMRLVKFVETFSRHFKKPSNGNVEFFHDAYRGSMFSFFSNHAFGHNKIDSGLQSLEASMGCQTKNKKRDRNIAGTSNNNDTKCPDLKAL